MGVVEIQRPFFFTKNFLPTIYIKNFINYEKNIIK